VQKTFGDQLVPRAATLVLGPDLFGRNLLIVLTIRMAAIAKRISPVKLKEGIIDSPVGVRTKFHRHKRANRAGWPKASIVRALRIGDHTDAKVDNPPMVFVFEVGGTAALPRQAACSQTACSRCAEWQFEGLPHQAGSTYT
jgi:hypothetical protein